MKIKNKIKFSDITGMLERDGMREIIGGSGGTAGSGFGGGGGLALNSNPFDTSFTGSNYGGFGGSNAIGGGVYGSGSITGAGENSYSGSGVNNLNSSTLSNGYGGGWFTSYDNGKTTNNAVTIDRFFQFIDSKQGVVTNTQVFNFLNNELTAAGQQQNTQVYNLQLPGTVLNNVTVTNNYKGPSTIPQGTIINDMALFVNNSSGGASGAVSSSGENNASWYIMPLHGSDSKPTPLEAAFMCKDVYGGDDRVDPKELRGWSVSNAITGLQYNDPKSGFKSQLYERITNGRKEYCYVTAGTELDDFGDYAADVLQTVGVSKQYYQSVENAKALKVLFGDTLSFAGHSLGGGMAEANARATGESAVTFNAAGVSYSTTVFLETGFVSDTQSYIMNNDPLNILQKAIPGLVTAGGEKHIVNQNGSSSGGHGIDAMIAALKIVPNPK